MPTCIGPVEYDISFRNEKCPVIWIFSQEEKILNLSTHVGFATLKSKDKYYRTEKKKKYVAICLQNT